MKTAQKGGTREEERSSDQAGVDIGRQSSLTIKGTDSHSDEKTQSREAEFIDVLMRVFNIKEFVSELKALLSKLAIRHLYVLVDDFS